MKLTKIEIRNFKRFRDVSVDLDDAVVFIGPNNMGKTSALQALSLWNIGLRALGETYADASIPVKRPGVTLNRKDLFAIPTAPNARALWENLHVRNTKPDADGKRTTQNIKIEVLVAGDTNGKSWELGLEFDYANPEAIYCRPLATKGDFETNFRLAQPTQTAFLPPMSGLADREFVKQPGEIDTLIGEGQTAQVIRNLCHNVTRNTPSNWQKITGHLQRYFGVTLNPPVLSRDRITLTYKDAANTEFDISSAGRGMQQTLLLLVYLYSHPNCVLLLDEPDAHLEILRQRQIFVLLLEVADELGSQIIAASHSEVILNEMAAREKRLIAFIGEPHSVNKTSQLRKALSDYGFEDYYKAEQTGWILYLEDTTDLDILKVFAEKLNHPALSALQLPFFHPIGTNVPQMAREHFYALREAKDDLRGIAIFDRISKQLKDGEPLKEIMWRRREIENYFCTEKVLLAFGDSLESSAEEDLPLLAQLEGKPSSRNVMQEAINELLKTYEIQNKESPWSPNFKVTDDFLDPLFQNYSRKRGVSLVLRKRDYYKLAAFIESEDIDPEIREKLDLIASVAQGR
ncbi:MAG: AAA family ATPase [Puniceicoccales bacterium]|jgi:ABC-type transport system involved in cytochrome c biogenesis ATPase subunit|nr:AAA family ATPase [Puniceicoccales bacterium]